MTKIKVHDKNNDIDDNKNDNSDNANNGVTVPGREGVLREGLRSVRPHTQLNITLYKVIIMAMLMMMMTLCSTPRKTQHVSTQGDNNEDSDDGDNGDDNADDDDSALFNPTQNSTCLYTRWTPTGLLAIGTEKQKQTTLSIFLLLYLMNKTWFFPSFIFSLPLPQCIMTFTFYFQVGTSIQNDFHCLFSSGRLYTKWLSLSIFKWAPLYKMTFTVYFQVVTSIQNDFHFLFLSGHLWT